MLDNEAIMAEFIEETQQHLQNIEPNLLEIEQNCEDLDPALINRIFRAIHSIKGASGFFGLLKISELSHVMENLLSLLRENKMKANSDMIDALLSGVDLLRTMIDDINNSENVPIAEEVDRLQAFIDGTNAKPDKIKVAEKVEQGGGAKTFEIPEETVSRLKKNGAFLYSVKVYLNADLKAKNKTPYEFIYQMESTGQFIEAFLDIDGIHGLDDCLENELAFIFIYSTVIDPEIVPEALGLKKDRIKLIETDAIKEQKWLLVHDSEDAESQIEEEVSSPPSIKSQDMGEKTITPAPPLSGKPERPTHSVEKPAASSVDKAMRQVPVEEKIRVSVGFLNEMVNLAGELVLGRNQLMQVTQAVMKTTPGLNSVIQHISRITTEIQEKIMQMRMQPVSVLFTKFNRIVRDLARSLNKEIKLTTYGEDVELDKTILEALSDPLTHLIRNSVDHGVEMPEKREAAGKPRAGHIVLKAFHQAGHVHIEISDDGGGIDTDAIAQKAFERGLIKEEQLNIMSKKELTRLIFMPGFSMAKQVTSVSGRGVGMDVVQTNIEKLNGRIDIETDLGKGTTMTLILPLTLAIVSGLVIRSQDQSFIMPEANIEELVRIKPNEIEQRINHIHDALVLRLRETLLPLVHLKEVLGLVRKEENGEEAFNPDEPVRVLITRHANFRLGIIVDSLENIEEIVVKPLPRFLKRMKCYSGASIMGNGSISLILDVAGIIEKANIHDIQEVKDFANKGTEKKDIGEQQTFLLFNNSTEERFALPLELITRIERIEASQIEKIKDEQFLQYHGQKLKLIFLEDFLPITRPERMPDETIGVIIPKHIQNPMGIVIGDVLGTVTTEVVLDTSTIAAPGLFGSTVLEDKITLMPDMYRLFEIAAPEWARAKKTGKESGTRILLVEDTPFFRMIETEYLTSAGYEVLQAEDGKNAMSILNDHPVDAVLLDIVMPNMDGWEVIKAIRADDRFQSLPVMAVTSVNEKDIAKKGFECGFTEWESKLNKNSLLEKLESMLH